MPTLTAQRHPGRIVLVTGSSSGNGRAIATRLAVEGAHIICCDISVTPQPGGFTGCPRARPTATPPGRGYCSAAWTPACRQPPQWPCSSRDVCYRAAGGWANLGYGSDLPVAASAETPFDPGVPDEGDRDHAPW